MVHTGLLDRLEQRAASRQLADLTVGPVLTWTTDAMLSHMHKLLAIPGMSNVVIMSAISHLPATGMSKLSSTYQEISYRLLRSGRSTKDMCMNRLPL